MAQIPPATSPPPSLPPTGPPGTERASTRGFHVIRWIEAFCVHTNGRWVGQPFRLLPWQKRLILRLFELRADGLRRHRWGYLSVAKKNGKTELWAAIGLYLLIGDEEPSPLVVCAAASDEQADLIFGAARTMCELSPQLASVTKVLSDRIVVPSSPGARLQRVAAVAGTNDGRNIHAVLIDELHEWQGKRGEDVWTVLTGGIIGRAQPLVLQITTAGSNPDSICGRQYELAKAIENGTVVDPTYLVEIHEAPDGCDYHDRAAWEAANPSHDELVQWQDYVDQWPPKKHESAVRRYFLNQWTQAEEHAIPPDSWAACRDARELDPALPIHVAVDMARTHDSTAVAVAQRQGDRVVTRCRVWANPYPDADPRHDEWRMSHAVVENYLLELREAYPAPAAQRDGGLHPGPAFYYDPWRFERSAELLVGKGLNMVEVPQTDARMGPASMGFYELVVSGTLAHDGDPEVARQVAACQRKEISDRAWRLWRPQRVKRKIDAGIASAIACYHAAALPAADPRSVYEERGLVVL